MKVTVDQDACVGCGLCVDTCPSVFVMEGDIAKVVAATATPDDEQACREAADGCPVEAIAIED
jgi:ferredoxin